ncbi:MAG: penicillin acylase family protein, partial [Pseudomonadota bacterium]
MTVNIPRVLKLVLLAVLGALALFAITIILWLRSTLPDYEKTLTSERLTAPVSIVRNEKGIPHIKANTFDDAAFALGYAQAQDRLWQMEMMRQAVMGKTAEIIGEALLPLDIRYRMRFNSAFVRQRSFNRLSPDMRRSFEAFAHGVNAAIQNGEGQRSPEWRLLGVKPDPWNAADVSNMMTATIDLTTGGGWELDFTARELALTDEDLDIVYTPLLSCFPTTYEDLEPAPGANLTISEKCRQTTSASKSFTDPELDGFGTNLFVIGPEKSATGKPIMAVDPHLPAQSPGVIYPVSIELPDEIISGGSWVGSPAVAFGHNSRIAWGMTHLYGDTVDFIVEKINPENPDEYITPDGPQPFEFREETFKSRWGDPVTIRVRKSRNGLIVSDMPATLEDIAERPTDYIAPEFRAVREKFGPGHVVAMKHVVASDGSLTMQAIVNMSRARNWDEFREALRDYEANNNLVYADIEGNIGLQMSAKIPRRIQMNGWNGQRLALGWVGEGEWNGFVPFDELAYVYNPPKGWIADSNGRAVTDKFPHRLASFYSPPWRASRSSQLLAARDTHDLESARSIQLDIYSTKAEWLLDRLGAFDIDSERSMAAMDMLQ